MLPKIFKYLPSGGISPDLVTLHAAENIANKNEIKNEAVAKERSNHNLR